MREEEPGGRRRACRVGRAGAGAGAGAGKQGGDEW